MFLTAMTSVSMLDWVYLNNMQSLKIAWQHNKESSRFAKKTGFMTKYHHIRSKLTVFLKISYIFL